MGWIFDANFILMIVLLSGTNVASLTIMAALHVRAVEFSTILTDGDPF